MNSNESQYSGKSNKELAIMLEIPKVQCLHLRLIELASFNAFDGKRVVRDLLLNRMLWKAVMMDREKYLIGRDDPMGETIWADTIRLRDLPKHWNVDCLLITPNYSNDNKNRRETLAENSEIKAKLTSLAKQWKADEVDWYLDRTVGDVLRIWWD